MLPSRICLTAGRSIQHLLLVCATLVLLLASAAGHAPARADTPAMLLKDINPGPSAQYQEFQGSRSWVTIGRTLYFVDTDPGNGSELWKTDGTPRGTMLVADLSAGAVSSNLILSAVDTTLYIVNTVNSTFWKSDGTITGTTQLAMPQSEPRGMFQPSELTRAGSTLFMVNGITWRSSGLWKQNRDGAIVLVKDFRWYESGPHSLVAVGDSLFFTAADESHGRELWKSDGTAAGTVMVADLNLSGSSVQASTLLETAGGRAFFAASDGNKTLLWASDGTSAGTVSVSTAAPKETQPIGDTLFFSTGERSSSGATSALWKIVPGTSTPALLYSITSWQSLSFPHQLTPVGSRLFFRSHDWTLWKSDGTPAGTAQVSPVQVQAPLSEPVIVGGTSRAYFITMLGNGENQLWTSDGTSAGTVLLKNTGTVYYDKLHLMTLGDRLVFDMRATDPVTQLWTSSGTPASTTLLRSHSTMMADSLPTYMSSATRSTTKPIVLGEQVLFPADDGVHGTEVWSSDGTTAGTTLLKDINPSGSSNPEALLMWHGRAYWLASDGSGYNLWSSDGTPSGTTSVKRFDQGVFQPSTALVDGGSVIYFFGWSGNDIRLWTSDGTDAGTRTGVVLANQHPQYPATPPEELAAVNGKLFFSYDDNISKRRLWVSDGSQTGTRLVIDATGKGIANNSFGLVALKGRLIFAASQDNLIYKLWSTDGSPQGSRELEAWENHGFIPLPPLRDFTVAGQQVFFTAITYEKGSELWASDGTGEGTRLVKDINTTLSSPGASGNASSEPRALAPFNGRLLFSADDGVHGHELWVSDGTEAGTTMIKDMFPGENGSGTTSILAGRDRAIFTASAGPQGLELWTTDGTPDGTSQLVDLAPGPSSSRVAFLTPLAHQVFFFGDNGSTGLEPHTLRLTLTEKMRVLLPLVRR